MAGAARAGRSRQQPDLSLAAVRHDRNRPASERARASSRGARYGRGLDLTLEHGDPVAQDQDLRVLGAIGPGEQRKPAIHAQYPPGRRIAET
jgi:hypothetical protein